MSWFGIFIILGLGLAILFSTYGASSEQSESMTQQFLRRRVADANSLSLCSFNIRYDGPESSPSNHFTQRVSRLANFLASTKMDVVGIQEAFSGQLLHLQSELPSHYGVVGYEQDYDRVHPARHYDYATGLIYNRDRLSLVQTETIMLSETPSVYHSKSWGSSSPRKMTMGLFKMIDTDETILVFNTHLDVRVRRARENQARVCRECIAEWSHKMPEAHIFLTGDFNSVNHGIPHQILTRDGFLTDSYEKAANCGYPHTYHGWTGTWLATGIGRLLLYIGFSVHEGGGELPGQIPQNWRELWQATRAVLRNPLDLYRRRPASLRRMHVDWILYRGSVTPTISFVAEVRDASFSSDHYPVVTLFNFNKKE